MYKTRWDDFIRTDLGQITWVGTKYPSSASYDNDASCGYILVLNNKISALGYSSINFEYYIVDNNIGAYSTDGKITVAFCDNFRDAYNEGDSYSSYPEFLSPIYAKNSIDINKLSTPNGIISLDIKETQVSSYVAIQFHLSGRTDTSLSKKDLAYLRRIWLE